MIDDRRQRRMREWLGDMAECVGYVRFDNHETAPIMLIGGTAWLVGHQIPRNLPPRANEDVAQA